MTNTLWFWFAVCWIDWIETELTGTLLLWRPSWFRARSEYCLSSSVKTLGLYHYFICWFYTTSALNQEFLEAPGMVQICAHQDLRYHQVHVKVLFSFIIKSTGMECPEKETNHWSHRWWSKSSSDQSGLWFFFLVFSPRPCLDQS